VAFVSAQTFESWPIAAPWEQTGGVSESTAPALRGSRSAKCEKGTEQRVSYHSALALDRTYWTCSLVAPTAVPSSNVAFFQIFSSGALKTLLQLFFGPNQGFSFWNNNAGVTLVSTPVIGLDVFWIEVMFRVASAGESKCAFRVRNLYGRLLYESAEFTTNLANKAVDFTTFGHISSEANADVYLDAIKIVDETNAAENTWIGPEPISPTCPPVGIGI
jgi:hypothetical protein